jgi:hypothetical protein
LKFCCLFKKNKFRRHIPSLQTELRRGGGGRGEEHEGEEVGEMDKEEWFRCTC